MRPIYDPEMAKIRDRCGDLFSIPSRTERASWISSITDQTAAAACVGWSPQWVNRRLDPEKYQRHLEYNARWRREKRLRERMSKEELKMTALVNALTTLIAPMVGKAVGEAVETSIVNALNNSEYNQSIASSLSRIASALENK